ncbi:MAG TPA: hypothetical protein VNE39_22340, partial [Planctomycetota bacterium]|nr:hypothetical protein [Planctomycetota bacterium]
APAAAPELAGRRLFLPVKCNLAGGVTGLAYRVVPSADDPEVPILAWEDGAIPLTAEDALSIRHARPSRLDAAAAWLEALLMAGGPLLVEDVEQRAVAAGFSIPTIKRARRELGVQTFHSSLQSPWILRLPGDQAEARVVRGRVQDVPGPASAPPALTVEVS